MSKIQRALISVSDKSGVVEFARQLAEMGVAILSTGGTMRALQDGGVPVTAVEDYTGFPEMMEGRVKTLHPRIHGAVVVNLYPFRQTIAQPEVTLKEAVENIDIGGPTMLRSAAKNFGSVAVVCNPDRYDEIIDEMQANDGALSLEMRRQLALEVFAHTGQYDAAIAQYLSRQFAEEDSEFPTYFAPWYVKQGSDLRYGENSHQQAALYARVDAAESGLARAEKIHGERDLSFNNYLDLTAALTTARDFDEPTAVIIKHLNPCGLANAATLGQAFQDAWASDPISAFGSVLGFNRIIDVETTQMIGSKDFLFDIIAPRYRAESGDEDSTIIGAFVEALIAPGYEPEALAILRQQKNLRIMQMDQFDAPAQADFDLKKIPGGLVVQDEDRDFVSPDDLQVVTDKQPTEEQLESLLFADRVAKHVKSNVIVLVQGTRLVGCGAGQMSRIDSCLIAARKAGQRAQGAVLASDAMFPARDGLDAAAATGAEAIIQPGGSRADEEVIAAANEHGLVMVFTGMRHFWH